MDLIENLEAMLASGKDAPLLRFGLANEYLKQDRPDLAVEHLRAAVSQDPDYSAAFKLLARVLAESGDTDGAVDAYERGIATAERTGDAQAAREMKVFLKRLRQS